MTHRQESDIYLAEPLYKQIQTVKELGTQLIAINQRTRFFKPSAFRFFVFEVVSFWIIFLPIYYATQIKFVLSFMLGLLTPIVLYGIGLLANKIKYNCNCNNIQLAISDFNNRCDTYITLIRNDPQYITQESLDAIGYNGRYHDISRIPLHEIKNFLDSILQDYEILWTARKEQIAREIELQPFQGTYRGGPDSGRNQPQEHCSSCAQESSAAHPSQLVMNDENSPVQSRNAL